MRPAVTDTEKRIEAAVIKGAAAFWAVVAESLPEGPGAHTHVTVNHNPLITAMTNAVTLSMAKTNPVACKGR